MAEKSPRPDEDAEEAAEAPVRPVKAEKDEEGGKEEAAGPDCPPEESSPPASPDGAHSSGMNLFANDGSFLELFKKKMEASSAGVKEERKPDSRRPLSLVGKRRGGAKLSLKTGMVTKKQKTEDEEVLAHKGGAWAQYMAEVKKYKAHQCSDDDKTRPLVK